MRSYASQFSSCKSKNLKAQQLASLTNGLEINLLHFRRHFVLIVPKSGRAFWKVKWGLFSNGLYFEALLDFRAGYDVRA